MRPRKSLRIALILFLLIVASVGVFYGYMHLREFQRVGDAELAFRPILPLGCRIHAQPVALHRYCHYVVEFPPDCLLTDITAKDLRSLNRLPQHNTLDVTIHTRKLTNESLPYLKAVRTFDLLDVTQTSISDDGIQELRQTFPDCVIPTR